MSRSQGGNFSKSVQWQTLNVGVQILIQLGFVRVLGEYLSKAEWGLVGVVLGFAGLLEIFAQLGVGPSLIQRKDLSREHVSAAFWFSLFQGAAFCALVYFTAPSVAGWFDRPDMATPLQWVSFSFLIAALALVPRSMLIRRMDFRSLFWSSLIAMVLGTATFGIWAATEGWGVYAYIGALLIQNLLLGLNYWLRTRLTVSPRPHFGAARGLLRYGAASTVFNFLNYAATKLDLLVLDKFLPAAKDATVGLYERSVYLMNTPVTVLGKLSDSVLFSGMSGVQDEQSRLRGIFLGGIYVVTTLVLPGVILLELFMEDVVRLLVGPKLLAVVPYARLLVLAILFRSWVKVCDAAVRAVDAIGSASIIKAGFCILVGVSAVLGAQWGLEALCIGMVLATSSQTVAMLWLTHRHLQFPWGRMMRLVIPGTLAAGAATIGALPALLAGQDWPWPVHLFAGAAGMLIGVLALALWRPNALRHGEYDLLAEVARKLPFEGLRARWAPHLED